MKAIMRYFASKTLSEHVDPHKEGFFQERFVEDSLARYNFANRFTAKRSVLDIACGDGYGTFLLSKEARNVIGVDISYKAIKDAIDKYKINDHRTEFKCADAIAYLENLTRKFDVITSFETVEHIKGYMQFIKLLNKSLRPGGILILSTPNKKFTDLFFGRTFNPYHLKEFYTNELKGILEETFRTKAEIYRQRVVSKKYLLGSAIKSFVLQNSDIVKNNDLISGLDNIYVIML